MTARLSAWWRLRSRREQRLLLVMGAIAAVLFAWLLVVRPVDDRLADARRDHAEAVIAAARAEAAAVAVRRIERSVPRRTSMPVAARVVALLADAGIAALPPRAAGAGVTVTIDAVRAAALFGWIERLERDEGLIVESLAARTNPDRTLAIELTIRGRR